ncbi:MAG: hypothetical protein H6620_06220 [Halobacteriovoraceae bacterium]|nr:hypothetical protein [Halobacteriovoraceae bacterium]
MKIILLLTTISFSVQILAQGYQPPAKAGSGYKFQVDPYTFIHQGSYEISGGNIDSGEYTGFGFGARAGATTDFFWIGLDANVVKPSFKSIDFASTANREAHPLPDGQDFISLGAGAALKISNITLSFTYFLDQRLKGTSVDPISGATADYTYYGKGWKTGLDIEILTGLHVFVDKFYSKLDQYELGRDIGSAAKASSKANRPEFDIDAWSIGVGFKIDFGGVKSAASGLSPYNLQ